MTSNTDFLLGIRAAMKFQDSLLKQLSKNLLLHQEKENLPDNNYNR